MIKKGFALLAVLSCIFAFSAPLATVGSFAETVETAENAEILSADEAAERAVKELASTDGLTLRKRPLYGEYLDEIGYVYDVNIAAAESDGGTGETTDGAPAGERNGFMIVLREDDGGYAVEEFFPDADNPYKESDYPVYGGFFDYFEYQSGYIWDVTTGRPVAKRYGGFNTQVGSNTETIEFTRRENYFIRITRALPTYTYCSYENSCANIAGGMVIGYYDSYFPELIPGYTAYADGTWTGENSATAAMIDRLYADMKTAENSGTTFADFKSGLAVYAGRYGRSVTYTELVSSSRLDTSAFYSAMNRSEPVVLFLNGYNATSRMSEGSNKDVISINYYSGYHTMVAYGCRRLKYFRNETESVWSPVWYNPFRFVKVTSEVNYRTDEYLNVRTVISSRPEGYIRLYDSCTLDHAIAVDIY